ncbi:flavo protein WrbA [Suhomyces tanzawaensis NRRL Y-17324]|uniref:Flavo protein WrbA n=1 Tax=Suhomyces tanzawaensis NRRL Y-17324 TaxID=984487 RepID=A0A1E4SKH4_9ASCO|nr:flavo protein WrbA [Suhomyces tanzawaensis NRRL Y-17324]ODV80015.1 flavo protein WrbA [Suhomyces tanzawaensis NRRL Y-17324]
MKIAIIQYSTYGHITALASAIKEGVEASGVASQVDILQVPETLSAEVLQKLHAPPKPADIKVASAELLAQYDAFLLGVPTRFGTVPAQWLAFWDTTGGLWASGALHGKPAGIFVSTGTVGGGQESTVRTLLSTLVHHGMPYVPLGYVNSPGLFDMSEVHSGTSYGSGTYAGANGSRKPSAIELKVAQTHGESFAKTAAKFYAPSDANSTSSSSLEDPKKAIGAKKTGSVQRAAQSGKTSVRAEKAEKSGCLKCVIM